MSKISEEATRLIGEFEYAVEDAVRDYMMEGGASYKNQARYNLEDYIAELEAAQRWIPVSERLPENENDRVLIRRGNVVALGWIYFDELMGDWDYRCYDEDWDGNPTHWMPLPKFPEVQE